MKITIIGPGKMALALAKGLERNHELTVVGRDGEKLLAFARHLRKHAKTALLDKYEMEGETLLLCVKPHALEETAAKLKGKAETLYSVLAGTKIDTLKKRIKAEHYVRAMPNLAAEYQASMTSLTGDAKKREEAGELFASVGRTLWVESEKALDIATAVAGSGPAYLAIVAEALADAAVTEGLKREEAVQLVQGLFHGMPPLLDKEHPALLKEKVMSPGGTTAAGCAALEAHGLRHTMISAIQAALARAQALGEK